MENFKGTKGDWYCNQAVVGGQLQSNFNITNENRFIHTPIAKCFSQSMNLEEARANAKLIAAAPELLDQLNEVLGYLNSIPKFEAENMLYFKISNLIKKATE